MTAALQIHLINCPENSPDRERLHTHLWKRFPMDAFLFQEKPGTALPCYAGSAGNSLDALSGDAERSRLSPEQFLDEIEEAVSSFLADESGEPIESPFTLAASA